MLHRIHTNKIDILSFKFESQGLCVLACPSDEKDAYCVNGRVYDAAGTYICPKDDKFTPTRQR